MILMLAGAGLILIGALTDWFYQKWFVIILGIVLIGLIIGGIFIFKNSDDSKKSSP